MPREALEAVTIQDNDKGSLPVYLTDQNGNVLGTASSVTQVTETQTATRGTAQASGAQTANGSSGAVTVGSFRELLLFLNVTAASGTTPVLNVYIDASDDGGTTWYQAAQLGAANITAAVTALLTMGLGASAGAFGDTIRIRWTITGTTPSFTFAVKYIGK